MEPHDFEVVELVGDRWVPHSKNLTRGRALVLVEQLKRKGVQAKMRHSSVGDVREAPSSDKAQRAFNRLDHFFGSPANQKKGFPSEDAAAHSAATLLAGQLRMSYGAALKLVHEWYRRGGGVSEAPRVVADFSTLDDLISHAARDLGATHVSGSEASTKIFFPRGGQLPYEEATVWRKNGYWHAQGPGSRTGVRALPRDARPISGTAGRRAAEGPRGDSSTEFKHLLFGTRFRFVDPAAEGHGGFGRETWPYVKTGHNTYRNPLSPQGRKYEHKIRNGNVRVIPEHEARHGVVEDYAAVDSRDRTIAGPFKHYSDAQKAAGRGGHVKFVPSSHRTNEASDRWHWVEDFDGTVVFVGSHAEAKRYYKDKGGERVGLALFSMQKDDGPPPRVGVGLDEPRHNTSRRAHPSGDEARGEAYADEQLASPYFMDWAWQQMVDGQKMRLRDPNSVIDDLRAVARNMLEDVEHDTRRDLQESREFFEGFRKKLRARETVAWLAEELENMQAQLESTPAVAEPSGLKEGGGEHPGGRFDAYRIVEFNGKIGSTHRTYNAARGAWLNLQKTSNYSAHARVEGHDTQTGEWINIRKPGRFDEAKGRRRPKARKPAKRKR